jgi:hypothetical protein
VKSGRFVTSGPDGAAAAYDSDDDTFYFPHAAYGMAANEQAVIIHQDG